MEIKIKIDKIDYAALVEAVLPIVKNKLKDMNGPIPALLNGVVGLPSGILEAVVNGLPQETKDQMAVFLINSYKEKILSTAEHFGAENGVDLKIADVRAEL